MRGPLIRPLLWLNLSWLNGKKLSNGPFLPVNDLAASAIRGQSHKELDRGSCFYWRKMYKFSHYWCVWVQTSFVNWVKWPWKRQLVSKSQYCNLHLFYDGSGKCPYLFYHHQLCMYILFSKSTLIPLSKTFFLPFTSVHFSIKTANWSHICCPWYPFLWFSNITLTG